MKKVLAIILAAVLVLSCNMTAFANIKVNGSATDPSTGKVTHDGDAQYVSAEASGDDLTVTGNVVGDPNLTELSVFVNGGAKITVEGEVVEYGGTSAISALNASSVTVKKDVKEEGNNQAIYASNSTVEIKGNVEEKGDGHAISVYENAQVSVKGDVKQDGAGYAINTFAGSSGATVLVEGTVTGNITNQSGNNLYIGKLSEGSEIETGIVHYLIGTADGSAALGDLIVDSNILAKEGQDFATIDGVEIDGQSKKYLYTASSDFSGGAKTITLKSNDNNKKLEITGLPTAGVYQETDTTTGAVTLTLNGDFKGGLQNLMLTLKEIIYDIFVDNDGNGSASSNPTQGAEGTAVDLTATPNGKYEFDRWEVVSGNVTIDNNKFNIGTENVKIIAHFKEKSQPQPDPKPQTSGDSSKTIFTGTAGNPVTNGKWTKNADGTWTYTSAYKFSNTWGYIANPNDANSAAWYYFDRNGNMLTGWQKLYWNGAYRWYYFSQTKDANEGKCQLGGITPDGYRVGADGAWIED